MHPANRPALGTLVAAVAAVAALGGCTSAGEPAPTPTPVVETSRSLPPPPSSVAPIPTPSFSAAPAGQSVAPDAPWTLPAAVGKPYSALTFPETVGQWRRQPADPTTGAVTYLLGPGEAGPTQVFGHLRLSPADAPKPLQSGREYPQARCGRSGDLQHSWALCVARLGEGYLEVGRPIDADDDLEKAVEVSRSFLTDLVAAQG